MASDDDAVIKWSVDASGVKRGLLEGSREITDEATKLRAKWLAEQAAAKKAEADRRAAKADADYALKQTENQGRSVRNLAGEVAGMAMRWVGVAGAIEVANRSMDAWAKADRKNRSMAVASGESVKAMEAFQPFIRNIARETGVMADEIRTGFDTLREKSDESFADLARILPSVVAASKAMGVPVEQVATVMGTAMHEFGLSGEQAVDMMDKLSFASKKFNLNLGDLALNAPRLMETMSAVGYKGTDGFIRMLTVLGQLRREGFRGVGQSVTALQQRLENLTAGLGGTALGTSQQLINRMHAVLKAGGDPIEFFLDQLDKLEKLEGPAKVEEIFDTTQRKLIGALRRSRDEIEGTRKEIGEASGGIVKDFGKVNEGFGAETDRFKTLIDNGLENAGRAIDWLIQRSQDTLNMYATISALLNSLSTAPNAKVKGDIELKLEEAYRQLENLQRESKEGGKIPSPGQQGMVRPSPTVPLPENPWQGKLFQRQNYTEEGEGSPRSLFRQIRSLDETMERTNTLLQRASYSEAGRGPASAGGGLGGDYSGPTQAAFGGYGGGSNTGGTSMPSTQPRQRTASLGPSGGEGMAGGGSPSGMQGSKKDTARVIASTLRKNGFSDSAIAGIMANVRDESNFNPTLRHPDQPKFSGEAHFAHGLYQEGGTEWNNYDAWLKKNHPGADWKDPGLQTQFLAERMKSDPGYRKTLERMNKGTKEEAAQHFVSGYLRPAKHFEMSRRAKYGRGVPSVEQYTGPEQDATAAPTPGGRGAGGEAARDAEQVRKTFEEPIMIRTKLDTGNDVQFRRASMRRELDRETREARWNSFTDIGAA